MTRLRPALALSLIFATSVLCICGWGGATEQTASPQEQQHATVVQIQKDALAVLAHGVGAYTGPVNVEVRMPGGATWRWQGQPIDRVLKLTLDGRR